MGVGVGVKVYYCGFRQKGLVFDGDMRLIYSVSAGIAVYEKAQGKIERVGYTNVLEMRATPDANTRCLARLGGPKQSVTDHWAWLAASVGSVSASMAAMTSSCS